MPPRRDAFYDDEFEIPWTVRLADFLLGASEQLGGYGQRRRQRQFDESVLEDRVSDNLAKLLQLSQQAEEATGRREDRELDRQLKREQVRSIIGEQESKRQAAEDLERKRGIARRGLIQARAPREHVEEFAALGETPEVERAEAEVGTPPSFFQRISKRAPTAEEFYADVAALPTEALGYGADLPAFLKALAPKTTERKRDVKEVGGRLVEIPEEGPPTEIYAAPPGPTKPGDLSSYVEDALGAMGVSRHTASREQIQRAIAEARERKETEAGATAGAVARAHLEVPNAMDADTRTRWLGLTNASGQIDTMRELIGSGKVDLQKIAGGIAPWVNEIVQTGRLGPFPVPEAWLPRFTDEEQQFLAALQDYADSVLRQRSGAHINEDEFRRMLQFLASQQVRPEVLLNRLDLQANRIEREMTTLEHLLRSQRILVPSRVPRRQPAPPGPGAKPPSGWEKAP